MNKQLHLFGGVEPHPESPEKYSGLRRRLCTPAAPGSGPAGKFCRNCEFLRHINYHDRTYLKCGQMSRYWTHGSGSDIRAKWRACSYFKEAITNDE